MASIYITILGKIADEVLGVLIGELSDEVKNKLKSDPAKNAFRQALGVAIHRYATTGTRLELARPLLQENGPLTEHIVAEELAKIICFDREPNTELIAERWKAALENPPQWRNFISETELLLQYLTIELRATDAFRPVFDAQSLDMIATRTKDSVGALDSIGRQLENLTNLLETHFAQLLNTFNEASYDIRDQIYGFTRYIEEKTQGFVGRQWVFDAIHQFVNKNPRGYFFIIGDPGIGKSALAAQFVKQGGYIHHFNIRAEGINKAATFLKNVSAQLIAAYSLEYNSLPQETTDDARVLNKLLGEVSDKLAADENCIIVIDALDEVDITGLPVGTNPLYLPLNLPKNIYIVITMRDKPEIKPRVDCEQDKLLIEHDSSDNRADVADFIKAATVRTGIHSYITSHCNGIEDAFVALMVNKSEGNFIYLHYVLPEIEKGIYKDQKLETIPIGLQSYYEDLWRRMKGRDVNAWFEYKLPVIVALTVAQLPVWLDLISDFSGVEDKNRIRAVLHEWSPFLHEEPIKYEDGILACYRLYHLSFFDFVASKDSVIGEKVNLAKMHRQIASVLQDGWRLIPDE